MQRPYIAILLKQCYEYRTFQLLSNNCGLKIIEAVYIQQLKINNYP